MFLGLSVKTWIDVLVVSLCILIPVIIIAELIKRYVTIGITIILFEKEFDDGQSREEKNKDTR